MEQLSASEIAEWEAFYRLEPAPDWKDDMRFAYGMSTLGSLLIRAHFKQGSELFDTEDFLIDWEDGKTLKQKAKEQPQSIDAMKNFMLQFASSQNKRIGNVDGIKKSKRLKK